MSNLTWGTVLDIAEKKLSDEGNDQWSQAELLRLGAQTLRKIIALVPESYIIVENIRLISGTKQMVPADCIDIVRPIRNMATTGTTASSAITFGDLDVMRQCYPDFASDTSTGVVQNVMRADEQGRFYVYPPNDGTQQIEVEMSKVPPLPAYDAAGDWEVETIPLSDRYASAIVDGILYMAFDDDTDLSGNAAKAEIHYKRFLQILGVTKEEDSK
ncbi:MAG: hypothetical protein GY841_16115 [FCB group bacterium]|nr:hypothetical protein [FCB group bacterium]